MDWEFFHGLPLWASLKKADTCVDHILFVDFGKQNSFFVSGHFTISNIKRIK